MMGVIQVDPVLDDAAHRTFCGLPYRLHAHDPNWVAPLYRAEEARWAPTHPALAHRHADRFLASRDGHVVGRIAAIADPAFAERWAPSTGFFGFFDCEDDVDAARELLDAAGAALAARGLARMVGPVQLTTHDEVGLLVDGFDDPPMVLSPWNPRSYPALLEACGCTARTSYDAWLWTLDSMRARGVTQAPPVADGAGAVTFRSSDPARWEEEVRVMFELYNAAFDRVWGFVPATWEEFEHTARDLKTFYRPELALFAEVGTRTVGFGLALPDLNRALRGLDGVRTPLAWLQLAWRIPKIDRCRLILLAVLPEFRRRGIGGRMAYELGLVADAAGMHTAELSLMHEENRAVLRLAEAYGGRRIKTYRLYERGTARHGAG